jgi:hypothetical protein
MEELMSHLRNLGEAFGFLAKDFHLISQSTHCRQENNKNMKHRNAFTAWRKMDLHGSNIHKTIKRGKK